MPEGCLGCNPDVEPVLEAHGITVEEIPLPKQPWSDVIVCPRCGRAWLLMPRDNDPDKPVA